MNKIGYILSVFIAVSCFSGCKKTKLEGEFEIFEGKWRWFQTTSYSNVDYWNVSTRTPDFSDNIDLVFDKRGTYLINVNNEKEHNGRLTIENMDSYYKIKLSSSRRKDDIFDNQGDRATFIGQDTMVLLKFPFGYSIYDEDNNWNYYVRE